MISDDDTLPPAPAGVVDLGALHTTLGFALRRAQVALAQDFQARFAGESIRSTQFAVLTVLKHNPGLRQSQVSFALGIKRTNFVPLFDELERRGLAERRRVAGDRRAAALFLTPAGSETLARLEVIARQHEDRFAARLGINNGSILRGLLARVADRAFDAG